MFYTYILETSSKSKPPRRYIGHTADLRSRLPACGFRVNHSSQGGTRRIEPAKHDAGLTHYRAAIN